MLTRAKDLEHRSCKLQFNNIYLKVRKVIEVCCTQNMYFRVLFVCSEDNLWKSFFSFYYVDPGLKLMLLGLAARAITY